MSDVLEEWIKSQGVGSGEVRAEQLRQLSNFFIKDDNLEMKTELSKEQIGRMDSGEFLEDFLRRKWRIKTTYKEENKREMAKMISYRRKGRGEAVSVLKQNIEIIGDQKSTAEKVLM